MCCDVICAGSFVKRQKVRQGFICDNHACGVDGCVAGEAFEFFAYVDDFSGDGNNVLHVECRKNGTWQQDLWVHVCNDVDFGPATISNINMSVCAGDPTARVRFKMTGDDSFYINSVDVNNVYLEAH